MENTKHTTTVFSFFKSPVTNVQPYRSISLHDVYKVLTGTRLKLPTYNLRLIKDQDLNRRYKSECFDFVTFSGVFSRRGAPFLEQYSGLLVIDLDHLSGMERVKQQLLFDPYFETQLLFTSPNGNGIKWVIKLQNQDPSRHGYFFGAVSNYLRETYHIEADKSGRDLARNCFLCYDPDAFLHPAHGNMNRIFDGRIYLVKRKRFIAEDWMDKPVVKRESEGFKQKSYTRQQMQVELVVRRIEVFRVDLTSQYEDWIKLGFALASEFGEGGRGYFHRISQFHGDYRVQECDAKYDTCLRGNGGGITIRSFFAMAGKAGVNIKD